MDWLSDLSAAYPWGIYVLAALGPFIQEDAAIISVAAAAAAGAGDTTLLYVSLLIGLSASDLWKYWLGRAGHTHAWGRSIAGKPGVQAAREKVVNRLGMSLIVARFVPGTRIPLYLACGFFRAPFWKVAIFVVGSAVVYTSIAFVLFRKLGAMAGERIEQFAPIVAAALVICIIGYLLFNRWHRRRVQADPAE